MTLKTSEAESSSLHRPVGSARARITASNAVGGPTKVAKTTVKKSKTPKKKVSPRSASSVDVGIGELIRARRLEVGMSQMSLADAIGVTFQQIQKYEKGINRVAASTLLRVARALDCAITDLLPSETA
ncbi:MAG TPA: helix-turn-helix transcriptional regulator [Verrucomicrobiae bacterium]|nr:helix-turn-helix transcriptional regulator [Verrucomicrobiae bacterium]